MAADQKDFTLGKLGMEVIWNLNFGGYCMSHFLQNEFNVEIEHFNVKNING